MLKSIWSYVGRMTFFLSVWTLCGADNNYVLNEHQSFILNGVATVLRTCTPATMTLLNENAYPILTGDNGGVLRAHVAATEFGDGRIIAYSHTSFYVNDLPEGVENDNMRLLINSINWVRRSVEMHKIGLYTDERMKDVLSELGFGIQVLTTNDIEYSTLSEQFEVVLFNRWGTDTRLMNLRNFVRNGGGLLLGATGWTADPDNLESYCGNILLQDTGIFYIPFYSYGSKLCDENCFETSTEHLKDTNSYLVWQDLMDFDWHETMPRERLTQMMEVLFDRLRFGPRTETLYDYVSGEAHRILKHIPIVVPTPTDPVVHENEKTSIVYHRYWIMLLNLIGRTGNISPHPAAESFPGTVSLKNISPHPAGESFPGTVSLKNISPHPAGESFPGTVSLMRFYSRKGGRVRVRARETVEIDGGIKWYSTGLYAQPGDEIKIQALNTNSFLPNLNVQIGIHSDDIEISEQWRRCPYIVFQNQIKNGKATIANPFGGLISIGSSTQQNISAKFLVDGGVRSPTYFLGKTKLNEWKYEIRNNPAPWGELIGKKLIISMQSSLLKQLDDPQEVIEKWDLMLDTIADLAVISHERISPLRIVSDIQIDGGGWMHNGYPIMIHLESQSEMINMTQMVTDPWTIWGQLHEIGHNHQKQDWNFQGTREVTCNLFALYVLHKVFKCPTNSTESYSDANVAKRVKTYIENGKQFSQWQSDNGLAFDTYVQLQKAYGWSAYKTVFAKYQLLTENDRPKNDEERIDMWMVMFSRAVQENMAEFFISWGFPISSEAIELVEKFPPTSLRIPYVEIVVD